VWDELQRRGVLVVCAAGNEGEDLDGPEAPYPAGLGRSNILCVGAATMDGRVWRDASGKLRSGHGAKGTHLLAPSCGLAVSDGTGQPALAEAGTSYAAPLATGVAAAVMAMHPAWTPEQVIDAMVAASRPTPDTGKTCRGGLLQWPKPA
jgi:subtilisin family serine protease